MELKDLLARYRRGRDGFDSICLEATQLYLAGELLPPLASGEEKDLASRLEALTGRDVGKALEGKLGTLLMSREEYAGVLDDVAAFLREWQGSTDD